MRRLSDEPGTDPLQVRPTHLWVKRAPRRVQDRPLPPTNAPHLLFLLLLRPSVPPCAPAPALSPGHLRVGRHIIRSSLLHLLKFFIGCWNDFSTIKLPCMLVTGTKSLLQPDQSVCTMSPCTASFILAEYSEAHLSTILSSSITRASSRNLTPLFWSHQSNAYRQTF